METAQMDVLGGLLRVSREGCVFRKKKGSYVEAKQTKCGRNCGYMIVTYWEQGVQKREYVHRLVAFAFIPNPENLPQVNHIDGNKHNNNANNLEWCTPMQNVHHAIRTGLMDRSRNKWPCVECGTLTETKTHVCTQCRIANALDERAIQKYMKVIYSGRRLLAKNLSAKQRMYVELMSKGYSHADIARKCGVSRQCVNKAIHNLASEN